MTKSKLLLLTSSLLIASAAFAVESNGSNDWKFLLKSKEKEYPGCVMLVREQLSSVADDQFEKLVPLFLETCVTGREIGAERTKKIYGITKDTKPRKLGRFTIKIEPPTSSEDKEWDIGY